MTCVVDVVTAIQIRVGREATAVSEEFAHLKAVIVFDIWVQRPDRGSVRTCIAYMSVSVKTYSWEASAW